MKPVPGKSAGNSGRFALIRIYAAVEVRELRAPRVPGAAPAVPGGQGLMLRTRLLRRPSASSCGLPSSCVRRGLPRRCPLPAHSLFPGASDTSHFPVFRSRILAVLRASSSRAPTGARGSPQLPYTHVPFARHLVFPEVEGFLEPGLAEKPEGVVAFFSFFLFNSHDFSLPDRLIPV